MGTWGVKLYDDDDALDLRELVSVLIKIPRTGDQILQLILDNKDVNDVDRKCNVRHRYSKEC